MQGAALVSVPVPIHAALIDLDGTLVDTLDEICAAANAMLREAGRAAITREEAAAAIGRGAHALVERVLGADQVERWLPVYMHHYRLHNASSATLYPGVREGLEQMGAAGLMLACVTNKPRELVVQLLERLAIAEFFTAIVGGGDTRANKPDPEPLHLACARLGVAPQNAVMIGDSENDARAARAAGSVSLTVPYGYPGAAGEAAGAEALLRAGMTCAIVESLADAARWIAERNRSLAQAPAGLA